MNIDPIRIAGHIRERVAKSTLDSPAISITREGWVLIIRLLEAHAIEGLKHAEEAEVQDAGAKSDGARPEGGAEPEAPG